MANTGFTIAGAGATVDRAAANAWANPSRITADDASTSDAGVPTDYLIASSFGFAIPADSTIDGIIVRVQSGESGSGSSNYIPQLSSDTTPTLIGTAKAAVTVTGTTQTNRDSGASNDVWGASLTPTIVNASGFGVTIWSTDTVNTLSVDAIWIDVYYTPPATLTLTKTLAALTLASDLDAIVTAALAKTLGTLTLSSDASVTSGPTLTLNKTLGTLTLAADASVAIQASLDRALGALTLVSEADVAVITTLTRELAALTLSAEADVATQVTLSRTLGALLLAADADVAVQSSLSSTLGALLLQADASIGVQASLARELGALTLTAATTVADGPTMTLAQLLGSLTLQADITVEGGVTGMADPTVRHREPWDLDYLRWKYRRELAKVRPEAAVTSVAVTSHDVTSLDTDVTRITELVRELEQQLVDARSRADRRDALLAAVEARAEIAEALLEAAALRKARQRDEEAAILVALSLLFD